MPQFDISTFSSQLFWLFVSFSIVYLTVSFIFVPRVRKILGDRDHGIQEINHITNENYVQIKILKQEMDAAIAHGHAESERMYQESIEEFEEIVRKKTTVLSKELEDLREDSTLHIAKIKKDLDAQRDEMAKSYALSILNKILCVTVQERQLPRYRDKDVQ